MKFLGLFFCIGFLMIFAVSVTLADNDKPTEKGADVKEWHNQTVCPVMGGKIDSSSYTDIQGQRVYHCCVMCTKKLQADPDKYFKDSFDAGILFENIQIRCPVTGNKLENKNSFTIYEGRRIYFCSNDCHEKFMKDPQKYLKTLADFTTEEVENKKNIKYKGKVHNK